MNPLYPSTHINRVPSPPPRPDTPLPAFGIPAIEGHYRIERLGDDLRKTIGAIRDDARLCRAHLDMAYETAQLDIIVRAERRVEDAVLRAMDRRTEIYESIAMHNAFPFSSSSNSQDNEK